MFAIAVPSTLTLTTPVDDGGEPVPYATISFTHPTDDVSKCQITLITADGDMHTAVFNTQGGVAEQSFTSAQELAEAAERAEEDGAYPSALVGSPLQEPPYAPPGASHEPAPPFFRPEPGWEPGSAPQPVPQPVGLRPAKEPANG